MTLLAKNILILVAVLLLGAPPARAQQVQVQVLERQSPDPEQIEPTLEAQRQRLEQQKRMALINTWTRQRRAELVDRGELAVNLNSLN